MSGNPDQQRPSRAETAYRFLTALRELPWQVYTDAHGFPGTVVHSTAELGRFIAANNGEHNIYYLPNQPVDPKQAKKPTKAEISLAWVQHADIDRGDQETAAEAKQRALAAIDDFALPPHLIVDSGNGVQALWLHNAAIDMQDPALRDRVEAINRALVRRLDQGRLGSEWNVDRVLRLPGTINLPNKKKLEKGWVRCESELLELRRDLPGYRLEDFEEALAAELADMHNTGARQRDDPRASDEAPDAAAFDALWQRLPEGLRERIAHGKLKDQSDDCYAAIRELDRLGVSTAEIAALFRAYPNGPAAHYGSDAEMLADIKRVLGKPDTRQARDEPKPDFSAYGWKSYKDIKPGKQEWLADPWVPRGELTTVIGPKTVGKTTLLVELSARWSSGRGMPGFDGAAEEPQQPPGRVLWLTHEERSGLLRHRLKVAGADLAMAGTLTHKADDDDVIAGAVIDMLPTIEAMLAGFDDWDAIVIEPITSFLEGVRSGRDEDVRDRLLRPLVTLARRFRLAVIYSVHMNKKEDLSALNRALNSVAFVNMPRSVIFMNKDPEEHDVVRFTGAGNWNRPNYAPGFSIEERRLRDRTTGKPLARVPVLVWETDTKALDADTLMAAKPLAEKSENAVVWLAQLLDAGPLYHNEIKRRAKAANIAWRTVERAKTLLRIRAHKGLFGWFWNHVDQEGMQPK